MTLNVNSLLCCQCCTYCDKTQFFCYKVGLYFSYLHIKFDDKIIRESLRISSIILLLACVQSLTDV